MKPVNQFHRDIGLVKRILLLAKPYWPRILFYFFLSLLSIPLALLLPVPLKIVVDNVIANQPLPSWLDLVIPDTVAYSVQGLLLFAVVMFIAVALLSSLQRIYAENILHTDLTQNLLMDFRVKLLDHSQRLSIGFHDTKGPSHASYRIQYDTFATEHIIFNTFIPLVTSAFTFFAMFYVIWSLDFTLAMVALVIAPLIFLYTFYFRKPLRAIWRSYKELDHASLRIINEVLSMLRVIKAFGREDHEIERYQQRSGKAIKSRLKAEWVQARLTLLISLTSALGTVLVLYIGTQHVLSGSLSLGNLLIIMSYLSQLYSPLKSMGKKLAGLQSYLTSAERAFNLLDQVPEVPELPTARALERAKGGITFENVSFSYDKREPVISDVSFEIPPGSRVGIAGKTGAGKSTLINLMFRFYDPDAGRILLDGEDLRNYRLKDLRRQFSLVLQDSVLFSASIAENIAYGVPNASHEEIRKAAGAANAQFVEQLPDGYNTMVGERGMRLSGGERQRTALARAFLLNAPILVLDEPTSAVDSETESIIVNSIERSVKANTTFIIAHRLSTLKSCDLLMIIDKGKIVKMTSKVTETIEEALLKGGLEVDIRGEIIEY